MKMDLCVVIYGLMHSCIDHWIMWSCIESMTKRQCHSDVLSWVIPSWIDVKMTHYCVVMIDNKYKWMNSKVVPLW